MLDRKKIVYTNIVSSAATIDIPISLDFTPIDNSEMVEDKFVDDEIEKVINPIVDYKKLLFKPSDNSTNWGIMNKFKIALNFFTNPDTFMVSNPPPPTYKSTYEVLSFDFDDLFCRTKRFISSFLRLTLYDTPNSSNNNVLGFIDIYTQVGKDQRDTFGFVLPINQNPISFLLGDPVKEPGLVHEGYFMYWFTDLVNSAPNKEYTIYMSAQFNNSKTGKSIAMYSAPTQDIDNIQIIDVNAVDGPFYMKIIFKNDDGVYKYRFEPNNPKQLSQNGGGINLSPSIGDPTITFWQISP